jgi:hypothetical protein
MHLSPELQHELGDNELGVAWDRHSVRIAKKLHARVLAANRKHGIGDVTLSIGVGEAQLLDGRN